MSSARCVPGRRHRRAELASEMAASGLRRLVDIGTFEVLQDKLDKWANDYYLNTCDQNVARGCEIIELNAKVQGQLFKLLSSCASEGGLYGGASIIKQRLLPWLGQSFFTSGGAVSADTSLSVLAEAAAKDRELNDLQDMYERSMEDLETDINTYRNENMTLREELEDAKVELNRSLRSSSTDKMFLETENLDLRRKLVGTRKDNAQEIQVTGNKLLNAEIELRELRQKLANAQDEMVKLRARAAMVDDYERQIRNLKNELALLPYVPPPVTTKKWSSYDSSTSDFLDSLTTYRYIPKTGSPLSLDDPVQRVRQQNLVSRFNDMFSQDRLDAMDTLRRFSDDHENNQRILFTALQEAFSVAKLAFRAFKMKVRSSLVKTHYGPETLEEAVQDYINRNTDLYDLPGMVSDVIRALNRNPKIFLPPDTSYAIIQPFIREACKLAWQMSALAHPLDISVSTDAELYDDSKYRRSYDSEYTAPLVNHHIWPCLTQGIRVLVKGEAVTRRGASLGSSRLSPVRGRSRSRSPGPRSRSISPLRRSRSPSPRRSYSPVGRWA